MSVDKRERERKSGRERERESKGKEEKAGMLFIYRAQHK